ncbi:Phenylacetaldoxime dehydratase-like protein [Cladobotryum mycophilum]|uniref:Phenylacetaldoxime dehydratase-like protein n=1 Tax=Cladobotryum mycophilum TaxID=491253 RepID=A0ABR0SSD6_9HYPO
MSCPVRTYPLVKPKDHRPPIPRWSLKFPNEATHVYTAYLGVQWHSKSPATIQAALQAIHATRSWIDNNASDPSFAFESFNFLDGNDAPSSKVWVCYWAEEGKYKETLDRLSLAAIFSDLPTDGRTSVGLWCERFSSPLSRLETNYSGLDYLPGLAKLPGVSTEEHSLTAYWGAARDRIPDSAHDLFEQDEDSVQSPAEELSGVGQHLVGSNYNNIVHIRSGQFWENCALEECQAYESKLKPKLEAGLHYIWENPYLIGAMGLRYLRNTENGDGMVAEGNSTLKETCAAGFFTSLHSLERWAKTHPSHLAIYTGAMKHAKVWGAERKFRTWHEVSVLKQGEANFEYLNCLPNTGVIRYLPLVDQRDVGF